MYLAKGWDEPGLGETYRDFLPFDRTLRPALGRTRFLERLPNELLPVAPELQALGLGAGFCLLRGWFDHFWPLGRKVDFFLQISSNLPEEVNFPAQRPKVIKPPS